jgi:hypothetical protein
MSTHSRAHLNAYSPSIFEGKYVYVFNQRRDEEEGNAEKIHKN